MSDYEDTVRYSLSNFDDEDILERLRKGFFTDEARLIALKILDERGYQQLDGVFAKRQPEAGLTEAVEEQRIKIGFSFQYLFVRIVWLFLLGHSIPIARTEFYLTEVAKSAFHLFMGIIFAVVGSVITAIIMYRKKNKTTTLSELASSYKSSIKGLIILNSLLTFFIIFSHLGNQMSFAIIAGVAFNVVLTIAIYKRDQSAIFFLAIYAFVVSVTNNQISGQAGYQFALSFVFLFSCQALLAEKRYKSFGGEKEKSS